MKLNKVLLNIASVFCFIFGAVYIFSLVFIPIGVYCFVAGKKFSYKADHLLDSYAVDKKMLFAYSIFSIFRIGTSGGRAAVNRRTARRVCNQQTFAK